MAPRDAQKGRKIVAHLKKTTLCNFQLQGWCKRGRRCCFAHSEAELQDRPDYRKTRLCDFFARGGCKSGNRCRFAHGVRDLRIIDPSEQGNVSQVPTKSVEQSADVPMKVYPAKSTSTIDFKKDSRIPQGRTPTPLILSYPGMVSDAEVPFRGGFARSETSQGSTSSMLSSMTQRGTVWEAPSSNLSSAAGDHNEGIQAPWLGNDGLQAPSSILCKAAGGQNESIPAGWLGHDGHQYHIGYDSVVPEEKAAKLREELALFTKVLSDMVSTRVLCTMSF